MHGRLVEFSEINMITTRPLCKLSFYLYIYPPALQESNRDANTKGKQLSRPASRDAKTLLSS